MDILQPICTGCHPAFATNGQVDWVAFGTTAWSITSTVLQRFSAAEIQPATYGAALALGARFRLGPNGQRRVDTAIRKLRASSSFQRLLWFGFGQKSFLYLLADNQVGLNCLALCACLADTHSTEVTGYILSELWEVCEFPPEYRPSHEQFVHLIKVCEGVCAGTTFGETVERMTGSQRLEARASRNENLASLNWERCADPRDIALVLKALFNVSMGRFQSIKVAEALECVFIGGIAEWLFDLRVASMGHDGSCPIQDPQVLLQSSLGLPLAESKSITRLESTSYYLNSTDDFWSQLHSSSSSSSFLILRVPSETCLTRSFGIYFDNLCALSFTLGEFIGPAARIYAGLALGEPDVGVFDDCREDFVDFLGHCHCHGSGFVQATLVVFPELQRIPDLGRVMHLAEARPFSESVVALANSFVALSKQCNCRRCCPSSLPSYPAKTCIPAIASMILRVTRLLGTTQQDYTLLPTISGLRLLQERLPPTGTSMSQKDLESVLGLDHSPCDNVLVDPIVLFSGTSPFHQSRLRTKESESTDGSIATAISWGGICAYMESLRRPAELLSNYRIVHVTSGQIQKERRKFNAVYDRPIAQDNSNPGLHFFDFNKRANLGMSGDDIPDLQAIVTERGQEIYFAYAIPASSSKLNAPSLLWLLPGLVSHTAIRRLSIVPCSRGENCANRVDVECQPTPTDLFIPDETLSTDSVTCCVTERPQTSLEQLVRLQLHLFGQHGDKTLIIRRNECLPCCIKVMLKDSDKLRRERQLRYERWEDTRVVFDVMNTEGPAYRASMRISGYKMPPSSE